MGLVIGLVILALGTWIGASLFSKQVPFGLCLLTAAITVAVSLIPGVGFIAGTVAFLICLVTIVQLDFWPEAVVVWFVVRLINFGIALLLLGMFGRG